VQPYFRDAVGGDVAAIAAILRAEAPHDPTRAACTPDACRRMLADIDRREGCFLLVAEFDGQIGAVLQLVVFPTLAGAGPTAEIVGLWVADAFRSSGLDTMLLDHAVERADDLGCGRVQVMAPATRRRSYWERAGFVHTDAGYVRLPDHTGRLLRLIS